MDSLMDSLMDSGDGSSTPTRIAAGKKWWYPPRSLRSWAVEDPPVSGASRSGTRATTASGAFPWASGSGRLVGGRQGSSGIVRGRRGRLGRLGRRDRLGRLGRLGCLGRVIHLFIRVSNVRVLALEFSAELGLD